MTYERFAHLPGCQAPIELAGRVHDFTGNHERDLRASLCDQIARASASVSNNIAEDFERGTTQELLTFIYIARSSAGEVRSMLHFLERRLQQEKTAIDPLKKLADSIPRQLWAWPEPLQNPPFKGTRYLNQQTRDLEERKKRAAASRKMSSPMLPPNHPLRREAEDRGEICNLNLKSPNLKFGVHPPAPHRGPLI
jgi:four helix bundle protein